MPHPIDNWAALAAFKSCYLSSEHPSSVSDEHRWRAEAENKAAVNSNEAGWLESCSSTLSIAAESRWS
jgi:hypothetical protein